MGTLGQWARGKEEPSEEEAAIKLSEPRAAHGELGDVLQQAREAQRLTLEQVEQETRIRQKYLMALEQGQYDELPTPGHIHGFLRNYARYLDLDMAEVEALYARDRAAHRRFEPRIFHPKNISLLPRQPLIKADLVLGVVIVALLAVLGYLFWQHGWPRLKPLLPLVGISVPGNMRETPEATATLSPTTSTALVAALTRTPSPTSSLGGATPTAIATVAPTETFTPEPLPTATPTLDSPLVIATPTPEPTSTPTATPTRTGGVIVAARFIDRVWLQVTVDGQESAGNLYEAGDEEQWTADRTIYMICGNAGGIELAVNGEELGVLGSRAQVVEKTWGPQGEITPTPISGEATPAEEGTPTVTPTPAAGT
jgi:cytoskeleton protein RodZ